MPELVVVVVMPVLVLLVHPEAQLAQLVVVVGQLVVVVGQLAAQLFVVLLHVVIDALHVVVVAGQLVVVALVVVLMLGVVVLVIVLVLAIGVLYTCADMIVAPDNESTATTANRAIVTFFITDLLLRCVRAFDIKARFSDYMLSLCIQQKTQRDNPEKAQIGWFNATCTGRTARPRALRWSAIGSQQLWAYSVRTAHTT